MKLIGGKIGLRPFSASDFPHIIKWGENKLLTYYIGKALPHTIEECKKRYMKYNPLQKWLLAIEDFNGDIIGEIELIDISWKRGSAELFIYIGDTGLWGKGYGTVALKVLTHHLFYKKNFRSIYLKVYEGNTRAIRCYEKCGFKKIGLLKFQGDDNRGDNIVLMEVKARPGGNLEL